MRRQGITSEVNSLCKIIRAGRYFFEFVTCHSSMGFMIKISIKVGCSKIYLPIVMKILFSILLACLVLIVSMSNGVIFLCYKLNREAITEKWCVNKDKPHLQCHGKCYLNQQLAKANDQQKKETPFQIQQTQKIDFYFHWLFPIDQVELTAYLPAFDFCFPFYEFFSPPVFQPPDGLTANQLI